MQTVIVLRPICENKNGVISRATKSQWSQKFSAYFKAYEKSTKQSLRWYHEQFQSY